MVSLHDDPLLKDIPEVDGFKVLEPCVLYSKLGEGGMGAVYRGRHLNLDIDVAVKCLKGSLADQGASFVQRFQREARLAAGIHHQNLVQVYDVSQKSGVHYLVMEFVSGETARDRVRRKGPLKIEEAMRIAFGAASGLGEAHSRRIVHRDVKPDNIMIGRDGSVKVSDLGLAKAMEGEAELGLTQGVMGTPQYMAPEQWEDSARVTPAVDVWALGATIYFLLAGYDPIKASSMQQALKLICYEPFPDIRAVRPDVSDELAQLIERCVARSTADRFADCGEVLTELKKFVGLDRGELVSKPGETTQAGATLVSPPPPETMNRIRLKVESRVGTTVIVPGLREDPPQPTPQKGPPGFFATKQTKLALGIGAGVVVVAIALIVAFRGGDSHQAPPKTPLVDESKLSKRERVALLEKEKAPAQRKNGPILQGHNEDPSEPVERGANVNFTLQFDEELKSAVIADHSAIVDGRHARVTRQAPDKGNNWDVRWKAIDMLGNESTSSFQVAIKPPPSSPPPPPSKAAESTVPLASPTAHPAPSDPTPTKTAEVTAPAVIPTQHPPAKLEPEPTPTPAPSPSPSPTLLAPRNKGCTAFGDESISIAGKLWAKRVLHERTNIHLVLIPAGSFVMGSTEPSDNAPKPRTVTIMHGFYMSENEVSEAEYAAGMRGAAPSGSGGMPYAGLSADDADRFCKAAGLELPTEAEWEFACRAGSTSAFSFGAELKPSQGATVESGRELRLCGKSDRNDFGLADMHGNLKEYCKDFYLKPEEYAGLSATDPLGKKGKERVLRGGSYQSFSRFCTCAVRQSIVKDKAMPDAGLRVIVKFD